MVYELCRIPARSTYFLRELRASQALANIHITYENHPITTSVHHNFEVVTASFVQNVNDLYRVMDAGEIFFFKHISAQKLDLHMYQPGI